MIASRTELEGLFRRVLARAIPGLGLGSVLGAQLLAGPALMPDGGLVMALLVGLVMGIVGVANVRRRIEEDLLQTRWLLDSIPLALPGAAILSLLTPAAVEMAPAAAVVLMARLVMSVQDMAVIQRVHRVLTQSNQLQIPRIRRVIRPLTAGAPEPPGPQPGVMLVAVSQGEAPNCPVCGEPVSGEVLKCRRCRTPHHAECFRYVGTCGMYACGGRAIEPDRRQAN